MNYLIQGRGGGGGGSSESPTETKDTIQMTGEAHLVHLLCEGEIEGLVDQGGSGDENTRKQKSIYIDEVPLSSGDFPNIQHHIDTHFRKGSYEDSNKFSDFEGILGDANYASTSIPIKIPSSNRLLQTRPITISLNSNIYPGISSATVNVKFPLMSHTVNKQEASAKKRYAKAGEVYEGPERFMAALMFVFVKLAAESQNNPLLRDFAEELKNRAIPEYDLPNDVIEGDIVPAIVEYGVFLSHNGGPYKKVAIKVVKHKASSPFVDSTEVTLPYDHSLNVNYWNIKIVRISPDASDSTLKVNNETHLDSVVGKSQNVQFVYPNSVMNAITFSAKEFPNIPQVAYQLRLMKVKVPKGYTPTQYYPYNSGNITNRKIVQNEAKYPNIWSGDFEDEKVWTDNPAWIYYDLLTNKRYGLGEFVGENNVDKWSLYQISKYCDELVPNNQNDFSGVKPSEGSASWINWAAAHEPRFTANLILNETEDAYNVVNNLASVFRGITYWLGGSIGVSSDREREPSIIYTNASVKDGMFHYSTSERAQRRTVALVRWNDPNNFWRPTLEKVEDTEGVLNFGIRENQIAAFATTSQSQAHRAGKWSLLTEQLESSLVTFELGLDGAIPRPTDVIGIYDNFRTNRQFGGRVLDVDDTLSNIQLDRLIDLDDNPSVDYNITFNIPSGFRNPSYTGTNNDLLVTTSEQYSGIEPQFLYTFPITGFTNNSGKHIVHLSGALPERYVGGTWSIQSEYNGDISGANLYRVLKIGETEDKTFEVTALEYKAEKYGLSQEGFKLSNNIVPDYNSLPIGQPYNLTLSSTANYENGSLNAYITAEFTESTGSYVSHYIASGKNLSVTSGVWVPFDVKSKRSSPGKQIGQFFPKETGSFEIRVQAVQLGGNTSATISETTAFTVDPPYTNVMDPYIELVNTPSNFIDQPNSGQYIGYDPELYLNFVPSGDLTDPADDPRFNWMDGILLEFYDELDNPISDRLFTTADQTFVVDNNLLTGSGAADLRKIKVKAAGLMFPNNTGAFIEKVLYNPPIPASEFKIVNANSERINFNIIPSEPLPQDFSGLMLWTGVGTFTPDLNNPDFVQNSLNGQINNSGADGNVYWALVDHFSTSGTIINGPASMLLSPLPEHTGWTSAFFNYIAENSLGVESSVVQFRWAPHQSEDVIGYEIAIANNDNSFRTDVFVGHSLDRELMYYSFKVPVEEKTYAAYIRAASFDNRRTDWHGPVDVYAQKSKFNKLEVFGESKFHKTTHVILNSGIVNNGDNYIDFSESNIVTLECDNSALATIHASSGTVREGATYILQINKNTTAPINWDNNNFKFNDAEVPDFQVDTSGVVAALGLKNDVLHCVANSNFV